VVRPQPASGSNVIHYHGGPITPESVAVKVWTGRHGFVSFARPDQIEAAAAVCQSFALDNGAFTLWKQGGETPNWVEYYDWCAEWLGHPACDWAVIPDVIDGTEAENDELLSEWPHGHRGVPVWHLNESVERLMRLAESWPRVALGSAAEFDVRRPRLCINRLEEALPAICDSRGRPKVKLHGLRMLNPKITTEIPLSSADSTNVAQNVGIDKKWHGTYQPATRETRGLVIAERIEHQLTPDRIYMEESLCP
jgi:hypothetical protein